MKITINNMQDVFKSKQASIETLEIKGYTLVKELFCDSSGMGQESEASNTQSQTITELEIILEDNPIVYTFLTNVGQFQVYVGVFVKGQKSFESKRIANNTLEIIYPDGRRAIRLHDTDILSFKDNKIVLNSGGWQTMTTKNRLNKYLPSNISVISKKSVWYVQRDDNIIPFADGLTIQL